ncbi:MAG: tRNA pseudouridine(38-40) synthase TruA [Fibrobacterota bacterium]
MKNFKMIISYDGTRYNGWQRLKGGGDTIQEKLEMCLSRMNGAPVEVIGSGRTDAGVHALGQVANFHGRDEISPVHVTDYCYRFLPEDIVVLSTEEVNPRFHARYNARSKTYRYRIWNARHHDIFLRKYTGHVEDALDIELMRKAARLLTGKHDFRAYTSQKAADKSTERMMTRLEVKKSGSEVEIVMEADGFLYNMARIIAGTLVEVGLRTREVEAVKKALDSKVRAEAGPLAPPQGLFLAAVMYDDASQMTSAPGLSGSRPGTWKR